MTTINKIVKCVTINGRVYNNGKNVCINTIHITFYDGIKDDTTISLYANTDIPDLFTVFTDSNLVYEKDSNIFDIDKILCDKNIVKIEFQDSPSITDSLNGYYTYYNKIIIYYSDTQTIDIINTYEFYILQSSNGLYSGYFIME